MKKYFLVLVLVQLFSTTVFAQTGKNLRIGYIDMEYILEKVPDYTEAKNQLEQKTQKWKQDIEVKKNEINKLKETLKTERVLLTKELIEEREEAIAVLEKDMFDYQQNRFGPAGDLIVQKNILIKPVQDQIFTVVQDLAESKKYDFIFDKSSDLTILFAAKRYDISDFVVRKIVNAAKRGQLSKKELKAEEAKEYNENLADENLQVKERKQKLLDKIAERAKIIADRKAATEERKNGTVATKTVENATDKTGANTIITAEKPDTTEADQAQLDREAQRKAAIEAKRKDLEDRKKAIADRKAQVLAEREAAKKEREANKNK